MRPHLSCGFPPSHHRSGIGERFAAFDLECSPVPVIDFEIEHAAGDQTDHHAVVVDAVAAKHGSGADVIEVAEHVEDVLDEWRCHDDRDYSRRDRFNESG